MITKSIITTFFQKGAMFRYIELTEKQINQISRSISVLDITSYIEQHRLEYEEFLEAENKK
jgi:hypothetical protein